jgi:hypothetical protein
MPRRLWLLLSACSWRALAHLTTVCTSTAPSRCDMDEIIFHFGTYHGMPYGGSSTPGQVHIQPPGGITQSHSFTSFYQSAASYPDQRCPGPDILTNAPADVAPSDAIISCYTADASGGTSVVQDTCEAFSSQPTGGSCPEAASYVYYCTYTTYYARVSGATSGRYTVWTSGTNAVMNACGSANSFMRHEELSEVRLRFDGRWMWGTVPARSAAASQRQWQLYGALPTCIRWLRLPSPMSCRL